METRSERAVETRSKSGVAVKARAAGRGAVLKVGTAPRCKGLAALAVSLRDLLRAAVSARGVAVVMALTAMSWARAMEPGSSERVLSEAEVREKYQNCPNGYYSGPRPGKARYTKDNFWWVVTPEFARKFCMPQEFVSAELKGAEAVAFRIVENVDEERCGWGGRKEVCAAMKELRFEIYIKKGSLPKERDFRYYNPAKLPSKMLITKSDRESLAGVLRNKANPRLGALGPFETSQFGINGFSNDRVVRPITTLYTHLYYEEVFEGIDYLALQGLTGEFTNPRMDALHVRRFFIVARHIGDGKKSDGRALDEFAHVIELPELFTDRVRAADKSRGMNVEELGKRAMGIKP